MNPHTQSTDLDALARYGLMLSEHARLTPRDYGHRARYNAKRLSENPYLLPWRRKAWVLGWLDADAELDADGTVVP